MNPGEKEIFQWESRDIEKRINGVVEGRLGREINGRGRRADVGGRGLYRRDRPGLESSMMDSLLRTFVGLQCNIDQCTALFLEEKE